VIKIGTRQARGHHAALLVHVVRPGRDVRVDTQQDQGTAAGRNLLPAKTRIEILAEPDVFLLIRNAERKSLRDPAAVVDVHNLEFHRCHPPQAISAF
jgi:hypothetical protein